MEPQLYLGGYTDSSPPAALSRRAPVEPNDFTATRYIKDTRTIQMTTLAAH